MIGKIKQFSSDVVVEMKKVSWPTKPQLMESTVVVVVVSAIITTFVAVIDFIYTNILKVIF